MIARAPRARPVALAALAVIGGLTIGLRGLALPLLPAAGLVALLAGAAALRWNRRGPLVLGSLLALASGGALIGHTEHRRGLRDCRKAWEIGHPVTFTGIGLTYMPAGERGVVKLRPSSRPRGHRCRWVGAVRVLAEGPAVPGELYRVDGTWRPARLVRPGPRPPERWGWVAADQISRRRRADFRDYPFLAARGATADRLWRSYPRRWAPLAEALVLGQRETVDREVSERLARSGLAHLLAISGLHVGLLALAFFSLARLARVPPRAAQLCTLSLVFAYVLLIGAPASAVRAALMILLWTLSRLAGRASSPYDALGLTAILLLLIRPWSVVEPGFQLSFAGAVAVGFAHAETRRSSWLRSQRAAVKAATLSVAASVAAVLLTAPITATYFGRVTPAAILGNLVAIPLLGLGMPALFLSALLSPWPSLAAWPAAAAITVLHAIDGLAGLLSRAHWAALDVAPPNQLFAVAYVVLLILGAHALRGAWHRRRFILALGLVGAAVIVWSPIKLRLAPAKLRIYVLDVGQGDAIAIATPRHRWVLVDAGPRIRGYDAGERRVVPFLRSHGVRRLEAWVVSHPDLDHVGGGPAVLDAIEVDRVIGSGRVTGQSGQVAVLQRIADRSSQWIRATAGSRIGVDGVEFRFLHPTQPIVDNHRTRANELSLVFLMEFGGFRMLFTGDAPGDVEDQLSRDRPKALRAHVLKVAHHGSASSTSREFLTAVDPELAVISVGRGNLYGHPSAYVLRRLAVQTVEVRRSDRDGTLVIEADRDGSWRLESAVGGL